MNIGMGLGSGFSMDNNGELIPPQECGESEIIKLKSNGESFEDVKDLITKRNGLKKWRRIPRELVKKETTNFNGVVNLNGDYGSGDQPGYATREGSVDSEDQSSRSSTAASAPRMKHDDQIRNGRVEPGKKARGFVMEKENANSEIGSDSRSSNFVFVQGTNTVVTSQGSQSGSLFVNYDEEYSDDDNRLSDAEFDHVSQEDVAAEKSWKVKEDSTEKDEDDLVESFKGLDFAQKEFEKEVQKWKDIGKDDPSVFDDSIKDMLDLKDAKILELESTLISGDAELQDLLKKIIQAEVEYVVIATTTKRLTEELLCEIKNNLQQSHIASQEMKVAKKQGEKLETKEDVKNKVCIYTTCFFIQLMLLFVILFLKFSPKDVEVVPT